MSAKNRYLFSDSCRAAITTVKSLYNDGASQTKHTITRNTVRCEQQFQFHDDKSV